VAIIGTMDLGELKMKENYDLLLTKMQCLEKSIDKSKEMSGVVICCCILIKKLPLFVQVYVIAELAMPAQTFENHPGM
jgi:hypothetical protein